MIRTYIHISYIFTCKNSYQRCSLKIGALKSLKKKVSLKMDLNGIINILFVLTKTKIDIPASVKPLLSIPVEKYKDRSYAMIRKHAVLDFPYNAIDINNPEEIEAAVEKHTRKNPKAGG